MEGVERNQVRLLPHREEWALEYAEVARRLAAALGENALEIQHVGSTAIRGICAKPILDVAVRVVTFAKLDGVARLGYEACGESGVPGRFLFVLREGGHLSLQHIHCYEDGNPAFQKQVKFRDYLNAHPEEARKYDRLKRELAEKYPESRSLYTAGKETFIQRILELA